MATYVPVKKELLIWAYNRSIHGEKLNKKFKYLDQWLAGEKKPTLKQLEDFAAATATPLGYFFLTEPPIETLPIPHYRTLEDGEGEKASPDLIETLHIMQRRQDFMRDYYEQYVGTELDFVGSYRDANVSHLANTILELLDLQQDWARQHRTFHDALKFLIAKCEKNRIIVMQNGIVGVNTHRPLNVAEFRGFVLVDSMAPLIFINASDTKSAQIFTLIHEIAHILIGSSAVVEASPLNSQSAEVEKLCNEAAAEMLCPTDLFRKQWQIHYPDGEVYETLSNIFKVSPIVIGRRAMDLNCISKEEFFSFYNHYLDRLKDQKRRPSSGGDFYNTTISRLGNVFTNAVVYQTITGNIQYTDAFRLTGLRNKTFGKLVQLVSERGV
ncbi:ImmA/IrrE family metallo-endopeptidase [Paenibacillus campinasensis]|uniref:ImmA/IrrE family metallo-endopeptidase n=1 Tax=Paenibacillus campinasensis TaxID=66347 RepID=A0ABW9TB77_9BACL|nr:ImmA/IrrE family metallo-endopeptidase [Paenibacillus campinasensis]MUG68436.1 ImmA/IrrE family metallo-endopeptidase [Paenibacillus campinasensis]